MLASSQIDDGVRFLSLIFELNFSRTLLLHGESTIDSSGVEIITPVHAIIRNTCNTRSIAFLGDGKSGLTAITLTSPQKSDNVHVSDDLAKPKSVLQ